MQRASTLLEFEARQACGVRSWRSRIGVDGGARIFRCKTMESGQLTFKAPIKCTVPKAISENLRLFDKPAGSKCDREELELFIVHHAALHSKLMLRLLRRL